MYISIVGIYSLATTHGGPMDGVVALICGAWRAGVSAGGRRHEDAIVPHLPRPGQQRVPSLSAPFLDGDAPVPFNFHGRIITSSPAGRAHWS